MKRKAEQAASSGVRNTNDPRNKEEIKFFRSFDHVDGNWPSHIFVSGNYGIDKIVKLCCLHFAETFPDHPLLSVDEPHLSLSKPFVLRSHQIQPFILHLGNLMSSLHSFSTMVHSSHQLFLNDTQTRLFLALPVEDNDKQVLKAVQKADEVLAMFRQPVYYADPKFHISIASKAVQPSEPCESLFEAARLHSVVPVGKAFYEAHLQQLAVSENSDSSDDECDTWRGSSSIAIPQEALRKAPPTVRTAQDNVLGGLLAGYDSSSDDESAPAPAKATAQAQLAQEVPALSKVITFDAVECRIGNRVFRLRLPSPLSERGVKNEFQEVLPVKK